MIDDDTTEIRLHRLRLISRVIVVVAVVLIVFGGKALLAGAILRIVALFIGLSAAAAAYYCIRTGSADTALALLLSGCWFGIVVSILTTGLTHNITFGWFAVLVCLGGLLGGKLHCVVWFTVSLTTIVALWSLQEAGLRFEPLLVMEDKVLQVRLHVLAQLLVIGSIIFAFVGMNAQYEHRLHAQLADLQQQGELRREAEALARQSDRSKTVFLGSMSHEIRTPLNSIIGFSSRLMKRNCLVDPKDEDAVRCILRNGKILLSLVNELLELANIESSPLTYSDQPFSIAQLVHKCVTDVEPTARSYGLTIHAQPLDRVEMQGDEDRIHQVLCSLIYFCIGQTREGRINVSTVRAELDGVSGVRVLICDTSKGIVKAQLDGSFHTDSQMAPNNSRELPISRLTLTLAAKLVSMHGGTMEVMSEPDQGTCFSLWLPLDRPSDSGVKLTKGDIEGTSQRGCL